MAENIEVPMRLAGAASDERRERACDLLGSVGLADRAFHRPAELIATLIHDEGFAAIVATHDAAPLAVAGRHAAAGTWATPDALHL